MGPTTCGPQWPCHNDGHGLGLHIWVVHVTHNAQCATWHIDAARNWEIVYNKWRYFWVFLCLHVSWVVWLVLWAPSGNCFLIIVLVDHCLLIQSISFLARFRWGGGALGPFIKKMIIAYFRAVISLSLDQNKLQWNNLMISPLLKLAQLKARYSFGN